MQTIVTALDDIAAAVPGTTSWVYGRYTAKPEQLAMALYDMEGEMDDDELEPWWEVERPLWRDACWVVAGRGGTRAQLALLAQWLRFAVR